MVLKKQNFWVNGNKLKVLTSLMVITFETFKSLLMNSWTYIQDLFWTNPQYLITVTPSKLDEANVLISLLQDPSDLTKDLKDIIFIIFKVHIYFHFLHFYKENKVFKSLFLNRLMNKLISKVLYQTEQSFMQKI